MSDLRDLYQETILEHSKSPRNFRKPAAANRTAEGYNPLCGDHFTLYVDVQGDAIRDIGFAGRPGLGATYKFMGVVGFSVGRVVFGLVQLGVDP